MSELKTETIVVNGKPKVQFSNVQNSLRLTKHQTTLVALEPQIQQPTIKQQWEQIKEGARDTRKVKQINPYATYFPEFYKKELHNAFVSFIVWCITWLLCLSASAVAIYFIVKDSSCSNYVSFLLVPFIILTTALWIVNLNKFFCFRSESKTINFKDEKTLSINITKVYKRVKTGHVNINWMSLTSYAISLLAILINFIVAFASTHVTFGTWDINNVNPNLRDEYIIYEIIFWASVSAILITLILQTTFLLTNYIRASRIENFYNFQIVPQEELDIIKKQKNRRDLIIFLCGIAFVGIIGFFIYRLVKRNKATRVVVS